MKNLKKKIKGIIIILATILLVVGGAYFPPAYALSDEEAQVKGYEGMEKYPEKFDFTGIWKKPPKSLEELSHGKIKEGMVISKDNVEGMKEELIDLTGENIYDMVKKGMELIIAPYKPWPVPKEFMAVTMKNKGRAIIDEAGNLRDKDGGWWKGGEPFFDLKEDDPQAGIKAMYNQFHVYDGDDFTHDWVNMNYIASDGHTEREVYMSWDRLFLTSREIKDPKPTYDEKYKDIFFKELVYVQDPFDLRGFGSLTFRFNDQTKSDDSFSYIPAMRRVRRLTSGQRFDAFVGCDSSIGDFRCLDVPLGLWNWKLIKVKPKLSPFYFSDFITENKDAVRKHLASVGFKFPKGNWRLWPEVWVLEATPKKRSDCPIYSKKVYWVHGGCWKSGMGVAYDLQGKLWKTTQNYWYGYGDGKILDLLTHFENDYYTYDHQIDHSSPWNIDLPHRKFNYGFTPERFSTKYLQRYGH